MAANWLRNIQGQLSEFATEVLNEAQNEVPDPESELQVEKKKSVEFERLLHAEKTRTEELTAQNKNLEEQLYSTNMEMDAISIRFQNMVESRDQQIKTLKSEVEQLRHQCEEGGSSDAPVDFQNQMKKLKAEVNHWKRIVKESDTGGYQLKVRELEQKLEEQRNKQQDEISALMELHQQNLAEEREHYEAKLAETQEPDSYDAQLKEKVRLLSDQVEELKQTIEDIRMNHVAEMSDLASKHGREIRDLQSQLEASEDAKELQERVLLLTDEVEEWRQKMEDEHIKHVEEMTALSEKHRDEIRNLQSQLAAAEDGWNCESSGLSFNSENSGNLEKEMPRLKEEVSMLEREDREDVERAAQTDDESWYASDEDEKNRLQMENAKLYDDMKTLSQKCSELEKRHEEEVARLEQDLSEKHEELLLKNIQLEQARKNAEIKVAMAQMDAGAIEEESQQLKTEIERMKLEHRLVEAQPDNPSDVSAQECARLRAVLEGIEEENKRLFEFIDGKIPKSTTADMAMSSEELDSKLGCQDVKSITDKDAEIRRLRMEVFEMLKAYNELNDDFNDFKERQANDDSNSAHRDFTDRIDSLKASLIEYEERYEQCKRENSETVAQLERLNADFEKLRYGMSCAASCSKKTDETLVAENKQLKELLKESMDDKDKLIADAHKFQTTVSSIDKELGNLRESNRSLHSENASLRETLNGSRDRVSETSALLGDMRSELSSIRDASRSREETLGGRIAQLEAEKEELEKEVELLRIKALENDTSLARYRAVVGHDGANIVEMNQEHSAKGSASEGSNNDWERTGGEWTTDQPLSSSSSEQRRPSTSSDPEPSSLSPTARKVDVERLEEKLEHALAEIAALSEQKNELEVSNADLSSTVENLNQTVDNIKASFDSLSSNLESMKMEHSQLIVERDNLLRKIEEQEVQLEEQKVLQSKVVASDAEIGQLKSFAEELEKQNKEQTNALEEFRTITENLKEEQSKTCSERDSLAGEVNTLRTTLEEIKQRNEALNVESAHIIELQKSLEAKHNESVMYYTKLQELAQLNAANEQRVVELEAKLAKCNQELALSFEEKDKLVKELKRLREHLVMMEETSTREAVAAEERETQLRKTVRMLEEKTEAATDTVVASSNQYQQQLAELTEKLELREAELEAITSRLTEREKSLSDTSKALSNLQIVLKDLSGDHEKELATYEEEMDGLRQDMQKATLELNAMKSAASEWDEERRFIEDTVAMQKEDLSRKDKIMEELENQIEELRHASAEVTRGSHRIDDTVLRQLFLSYFTANKDKQGEIALLLASVLEYPEEDIKKIQDSLQQNSRSWFSWMGAGPSAVGSPSITEQFIRFLEHESLAVRQQTGLPVESTAAHLPLEDSVQAAQPKSSADDLKSILES